MFPNVAIMEECSVKKTTIDFTTASFNDAAILTHVFGEVIRETWLIRSQEGRDRLFCPFYVIGIRVPNDLLPK